MKIGCAYYPEHWPYERWATDARMMQAAGLNLVRMAEFAWTRMEPSEGKFDFAWLDESVNLLGAHGIDTLLGTPTAAPPGWVCKQSPEILPRTPDGHVIGFGGRRHYCPTQPAYRQHVERIVRAMGTHYAGHRHVVAWQVDNELGNYCYCDCCQQGFRNWLQRRYGTLDALNAAWGTDFWSEVFTSWDEIPSPRPTGAAHNPSLLLAWKRFYSDTWCDYYNFQRKILQECGVKAAITTNMMGTFPHIDYPEHAKTQDVVLWDNYTEPGHPWRYRSSLSADHMRSVRGGAPYWIAEQQSGCSGHDKVYGRTEPGRIRLMTYQAVAHGGEAISYFRWRTCRFGVEQYWHGILQHDGRPTWRYDEVTHIAKEFRALPPDLFTARTPAKAALLWSHHQNWAHEAQPHVDGFSYETAILPPYQALRDNGVDVDTVSDTADLTPYRLLIAPAWQLLPPGAADRVRKFVEQGGVAVFTYRSGVRDWDNVIFADPLPGPLRELLGITIDDYDAIGHFNVDTGLEFAAGSPVSGKISCSLWADIITADHAQVMATFAANYYQGRPAITVNKVGRGQVWYIGTQLGVDFWTPFVAHLTQAQKIPAAPPVSERVEVARRQGQRLYTFVMNMHPSEGWIDLPKPCEDLLSGEKLPVGRAPLAGYGVRILV